MTQPTVMVLYISVLNTRRDYFDYQSIEPHPQPGSRVLVPFGKKQRIGIVVGSGPASNPNITLKPIDECLDEEPLLSKDMLTLCHWISQYYQTPLSEVFALALPKPIRLGKAVEPMMEEQFQLAKPIELARQRIPTQAKRQRALIELLGTQPSLTKGQLTEAGFSSAHRQSLVKLGLLDIIQKPISWPISNQPCTPPLALNPEQALAVSEITASFHQYRCFLLQGVTGSGKTEVYLHVIAHVLATGKQVLVLVPEIGLTPQLLSRFTARFNVPIAVVHSNLSDTERLRAWKAANDNIVKLVIGTRAAIFTPMPQLGLIIIDEEHDASLKQMDRVRYSARDTALMRAHQGHIPIILGTATPSLESLYNARRQKYTLLRLTQKAMSQTPLRYQIIDIRNQPLQDGLAQVTLTQIEAHLARGHQALVFINRRGFSPVLLCHQCGWMADCRACDCHLTLHRRTHKLICHHCGQTQSVPSHCQSCHGNELVPIGIGTQRIYEALKQHFPSTPIVRIDRDEVQKKQALTDYLEQISQGKAQLIVGTQMLAKGHHFPNLTLVVILDTDNGFFNHDFRSLERLGQLLTQVAGRAGREEHPGHVIIQTHLPQHPLLNLLVQQGYDAFSDALLTSREQAHLPPYSHLALIRAQSKTMPLALQFLRTVKQQLLPLGVDIWGPAPAPLARKAEQHRFQLVIKSHCRQKRAHALGYLFQVIHQHQLDKKVEWTIDVDPIDLA